MNKVLKQLGLLFMASLLFISCSKDDSEEVKPAEISGKWNISSAESNFETKSNENTNSTFDFSKDNLFIEFNADGTYASNAEFGIGELGLNPKGTVSNSYVYNNGRLELKLLESSLKKEVILYFRTEDSSNSLILNSDINDLLDAYNDQSGSFDLITGLIIDATIKNYARLDFKVTLTK